ncbi:MAG TPA: NAD(P)H-binding protein [Terriglobia bacterium]|nr:NAD(P)H-binding protein [Terriglobia bacterium]
MRIAITGGTGFVGRHLARALVRDGHEVVLISRGADRRDPGIRNLPRSVFAPVGLDNVQALARALQRCEGVAHCAGINREIGTQTYARVHIQGTANVVLAAKQAGVKKIVLLSFLRARPDCGSGYHESKWAAEEIVCKSGLDYTVLKAGVIYGRGDHMLDHLSHTLQTLPLFATVGLRDKPIRPLAVEDLLRIIEASLVENRLSGQTVAVTGPEEMLLGEAARRVGAAVGRKPLVFGAPLFAHYLLAWLLELAMVIPLVSLAQVRILSEGITEPATACGSLPDDLSPRRYFTQDQIRQGLPESGGFAWRDLRCFR